MSKFFLLFMDRRMLVALGMGFSSGLPLLLTTSTVTLWYKEAGVDIVTIGLLTLVGLPYTFKVLWSPLLDWVPPPFLGRRRGWLLITQLGLIVAICGMAVSDPKVDPMWLAGCSLLVAIISATQDIVIDAFLVEMFPSESYAVGIQAYVQAYRGGMLASTGGALILADKFGWRFAFLAMAALMSVGIITTLVGPEPEAMGKPRTLVEAVVDPFIEFFSRRAIWKGALILLFLVLYNFGGNMASALTFLFYADLGYTKTEIGAIAKSFGLCAMIGGGFVGALGVYYLGLLRSLWVFGVAQAVAGLCFAWLDLHTRGSGIPPERWALAVAIVGENFGVGLATAAYTAFLGSLIDRRFTATQYALFSSLMAVPRNLAGPVSAVIVKSVGWFAFFFTTAGAAIPAFILLAYLSMKFDELAKDPSLGSPERKRKTSAAAAN